MGAAVRATVDDAETARGVGIDTSRISMFIFALAALLALRRVIGGAFLGVYSGLDFQILLVAFAVVTNRWRRKPWRRGNRRADCWSR